MKNTPVSYSNWLTINELSATKNHCAALKK